MVRFRGRFSCQHIIDSRMPVQDPGIGVRLPVHETRP